MRGCTIACALIAALLLASCGGRPPPDRAAVERLLGPATQAVAHQAKGDLDAVRADFDELVSRWHASGLLSARGGRDVQRAILRVQEVLLRRAADPADLEGPLESLEREVEELVAAGPLDEAESASLGALRGPIDIALQETRRGEWTEAREAIEAFDQQWERVEDSVYQRDRVAYEKIEALQATARGELGTDSPDPVEAEGALGELRDVLDAYIEGKPVTAAAPVATLAQFVDLSRSELGALEAGDVPTATAALRKASAMWPTVEGEVRTTSVATYEKVEDGLLESAGLDLGNDAERARAVALATERIAALEPLARGARYSAWDAALILLREGLEALLAVAALLALLRKTGQTSRGGWVWLGVGAGLLVSAAAGLGLGAAAGSAAAGTAREGLEGIVGLAAVGLMLTVGAWLHGKSSIKSWTDFIKGRAGTALQRGGSWSLALVAFLAIAREGVETVVFYMGIVPSIRSVDLILGLGGAVVVLVVLGFLLIRFSVRLPLRPMFLGATLIVYYLAFKILGQSIHALQVAGALPGHAERWLPSVPALGVYGVWETFVPQLLLLAFVALELTVTERRQRREERERKATSPTATR